MYVGSCWSIGRIWSHGFNHRFLPTVSRSKSVILVGQEIQYRVSCPRSEGLLGLLMHSAREQHALYYCGEVLVLMWMARKQTTSLAYLEGDAELCIGVCLKRRQRGVVHLPGRGCGQMLWQKHTWVLSSCETNATLTHCCCSGSVLSSTPCSKHRHSPLSAC